MTKLNAALCFVSKRRNENINKLNGVGLVIVNSRTYGRPSDHHAGRRDVQERAVAPRVLHVQQLRAVAGGAALHVARRAPLLRRLLRGALRQALHLLHQAHHWSVASFSSVASGCMVLGSS